MYTVIYVLSIVAVNFGFSVLPVVELPGGIAWPPMSLVVGLVFVFRDFAQREIGHGVIVAMVAGAALSYVMADPFVAVASLAAFLVGEGLDWAVYSFTRRPFRQRVLLSSAIGTPADSVVFLAIVGLFSWPTVLIMTASKMLGALVVWRWLAPRCVSS